MLMTMLSSCNSRPTRRTCYTPTPIGISSITTSAPSPIISQAISPHPRPRPPSPSIPLFRRDSCPSWTTSAWSTASSSAWCIRVTSPPAAKVHLHIITILPILRHYTLKLFQRSFLLFPKYCCTFSYKIFSFYYIKSCSILFDNILITPIGGHMPS